jgi:hypothetical protein
MYLGQVHSLQSEVDNLPLCIGILIGNRRYALAFLQHKLTQYVQHAYVLHLLQVPIPGYASTAGLRSAAK